MTIDTSVGDFIGEAIGKHDDLIRRLKEGRPPSEIDPLARDLWNRDGFEAAAEIERLRFFRGREEALEASRAADPDYVHEGTLDGLAMVVRMIETWGPETFPVNEFGQIHFGRAMLESAAGEIKAYLARLEAAPPPEPGP